jgi:Histidine kinase-, DNA gyrase B-, and HSP90-like ATPase
MARINLKKFIAEHYRGSVSVRDVIREALTNAIHAGGKQISVDLHFAERNVELFSGSDEKKVLDRITIIDNGEGFTTQNLQYFDEICTSHKHSIGGKGVGRLAFLKYAKSVKVRSQLARQLVEFDYTPDFRPEDVVFTQADGIPSTSIVLSDFQDKINTQVPKLVNSICDDLRLILFLKCQQGCDITLKFTHNSAQIFDECYEFAGKEIKAVAEREFQLGTEDFRCYLFRDELPKKSIVAMLCADELCIEEYVISKRFDICRHLIFVTSAYFNSRSNIERQQLQLPKTETDIDMVSPISREKIFPRIHQECMLMINETNEGGIETFKLSNIKKLTKYYPFIQVSSFGGNAALLDADEMVKTYRTQQARKEDELVEALEIGRPVSLDDLSHLASDDLARYIVHRALVIDSLASMPPSSKEDAIHNAILPKKSDGTEMRENNVWLVDDKFLSYSSIFSDETLAKIVQGVGEAVEVSQKRRPDVAAFFSRDTENRPNKLVIIEFKKPGADVFENNKSLTQCRLYASALADAISTVREVFAFSVVEIDDEFYRDVFSLTERVVYNDFSIGSNSSVPLHLYVMPASALIKDAKARNRVFEDVLRFNTAR